MTILDQPSATPRNLVARVQNIILRPKLEWDVIDREPTGVGALFTGYAMILAAIAPVCQAIGQLVFGVGIPGLVVFRPPPVVVLGQAVVTYVMSLIGVFVLSLIVNALAPTFGGVKDQRQAAKVVVYASTASWLAGVVFLIPMLGILAIVGLYSLYLMYLGLPRLMKAPQEKAVGYVAVTVICAIVIYLVIGVVGGAAFALTGGAAMRAAALTGGTPGVVSGTINVPGGGSVDLAKLQAATAQMAAAANQAQASTQTSTSTNGQVVVGGAVQPVAAATLQALIPASIGGYTRSEVSSSSGAVAGLGGSSAEGRYAKGEATIDLQVSDLGGVAALGALAGAMNVEESKQTATGYSKVGHVNGQMTTEEWDGASKTGKYSVMEGSRFMVEASGSGASMEELKAAVAAVDAGRLASAAHG